METRSEGARHEMRDRARTRKVHESAQRTHPATDIVLPMAHELLDKQRQHVLLRELVSEIGVGGEVLQDSERFMPRKDVHRS